MKLKLAALIMVIAAVALAAAAFRLARKESERHAAGLRDLLDARCQELAARCVEVTTDIERQTEDKLRDAKPDSGGILSLERQSPFVRDVFFLDSDYAPVFPAADSDFFQNYQTLFFERITGPGRSDIPTSNTPFVNAPPNNQGANSAIQMSYPAQSVAQSAQVFQSNQADVQQPLNQQRAQGGSVTNNAATQRQQMGANNVAYSAGQATAGQSMSIAGIGSPRNSNAVAEEAGSQFELLSRGRSEGWIPWVNQNQFMPLVWIKRKDTGMVVGARIEAAAVIARLIPLISVPEDGFFHIKLTDGNSKIIAGSGYRVGDSETPAVTVEISPELLPGFQLRGFLNPAVHQRGNSLAMANILLVASLLLVVLTSAGTAFYFVNREMVLAGKKTSFVANVSHELKTPLTSIRMYSEMLRENLGRLPAAKRDHYLKVIVSESERLTRLIANILDFNKMEAAEKQYHPQPVEVNTLVEETMKACEHLLAEKGMSVDWNPAAGDVWVTVDRDSLVQVLQNLVSNAAKYAKGADTLRVCLLPLDNHRVKIDIADNGPGVPPRARRKLFKKFYRVDNDLTATTSGSGLGLTISRKLMRDQGGDVRFSPNPDGGAVFSIILNQCASDGSCKRV